MINKSVLLLVVMFVASWVNAQTDNSRYLAGAVPEVDGKVLFSKDIKTKTAISDAKLFELMNNWVKAKNLDPSDKNSRVLLSDAEGKKIALAQEAALTFKSSAISLDRAYMRYQLLFEVTNSVCKVTVRSIKYLYVEKDKEELFSAEDMITDKVALNKEGTKLTRYYDKFRIHTVDSVNAIFDKIDVYLNGRQVVAAVDNAGAVAALESEKTSVPAEVISVPAVSVSAASNNTSEVNTTVGVGLEGYRSITPDKIPGNIIKLLNDRALITTTGDNTTARTVSGGGLGKVGNEPTIFTYSNSGKAQEGIFTISFYTEAYGDLLNFCDNVNGRSLAEIKAKGFSSLPTSEGLSFAGAWMIIECKVLFSTPISEKDVTDKSLFGNLAKNGYIQMNAGQILNVWIR